MLCCSGVLLERVARFRNRAFSVQGIAFFSPRGRRPLDVDILCQCPEGSRGALTAERSPLASSLQPGVRNVPRTMHVWVQDTGSRHLLSWHALGFLGAVVPVWKEKRWTERKASWLPGPPEDREVKIAVSEHEVPLRERGGPQGQLPNCARDWRGILSHGQPLQVRAASSRFFKGGAEQGSPRDLGLFPGLRTSWAPPKSEGAGRGWKVAGR